VEPAGVELGEVGDQRGGGRSFIAGQPGKCGTELIVGQAGWVLDRRELMVRMAQDRSGPIEA
jgi:hypothetical protein